MAKTTKKGRPKGQKKATKNHEDYIVIPDSDKPVCPECQVRDYKIIDNSMAEDDKIKYYVKCNKCKTYFTYKKPLSSIFGQVTTNENNTDSA